MNKQVVIIFSLRVGVLDSDTLGVSSKEELFYLNRK